MSLPVPTTSSTYRAIAGACPTRLQLFSPGVHGEQFSDILRIQGSTELMIAHMLEVTYGTKAGVIMNYDSCAGVFREGACERFKLGDTAETIVKGNMDGTLDELRAALASLMSASNAELEGVVSTGVYPGLSNVMAAYMCRGAGSRPNRRGATDASKWDNTVVGGVVVSPSDLTSQDPPRGVPRFSRTARHLQHGAVHQ